MMLYLRDNKRHLICYPYSISNLHKMALDLNIKKCWYHKGNFPHYDIPKFKLKDPNFLNLVNLINTKDLLNIIKVNTSNR